MHKKKWLETWRRLSHRPRQLDLGVRQLCWADPTTLAGWLSGSPWPAVFCLLSIIVGGGFYGMSLGIYRSVLQGVFVAIKFPLLLLLTMLGTGLINSILAQLLGIGMTVRQSLMAVMTSFALLSLIVGSCAPLLLFVVVNLPPIASPEAVNGHAFFLLCNVVLIALAGILANVRLYTLLRHICGRAHQALQVLISWLMVNMFLGCQLSWNLRPFFGHPDLPVRFLRDDPFANSFYEAIYYLLT